MLNTWLNSNERIPCPYSQFKVTDVEQVSDLSPDTRSHLISLLSTERFDPELLKTMAQYLGRHQTKELIVKEQMPTNINTKRGDFGETLFNAILEQFHGYRIPVRKLRFKITANQTLPGTDSLAFRIDDTGLITEVCFVESKLRTSQDNMAAVNGYKQLQNNYESELPAILKFVAARLYDQKDSLFEAFMSYLGDRNDTRVKDKFRLSLCWEHLEWNETVLENLQDNGVALPELTLHVIRINNLRQITDELFAELGATVVSDED